MGREVALVIRHSKYMKNNVKQDKKNYCIH